MMRRRNTLSLMDHSQRTLDVHEGVVQQVVEPSVVVQGLDGPCRVGLPETKQLDKKRGLRTGTAKVMNWIFILFLFLIFSPLILFCA